MLCSLPDSDVYRLRLRVGAELGTEEIEPLVAAGERAEAVRVALRYLAVRPRSRQEVSRRLRRDRFGREVVDHVLDRLTSLGYLDDAEFAAAFARSRIRLRPCGRRRMRADLVARGVSPEDADSGIRAAMAGEGVTEAALMNRAASARARSLSGADRNSAKRRMYGYLARRGFSAESIRAWIDSCWPPETRDDSVA